MSDDIGADHPTGGVSTTRENLPPADFFRKPPAVKISAPDPPTLVNAIPAVPKVNTGDAPTEPTSAPRAGAAAAPKPAVAPKPAAASPAPPATKPVAGSPKQAPVPVKPAAAPQQAAAKPGSTPATKPAPSPSNGSSPMAAQAPVSAAPAPVQGTAPHNPGAAPQQKPPLAPKAAPGGRPPVAGAAAPAGAAAAVPGATTRPVSGSPSTTSTHTTIRPASAPVGTAVRLPHQQPGAPDMNPPTETAYAAAGTAATVGATKSAAEVLSAPRTRRTRKARLRLSRVDPWSVMKTVFLFSVSGAIMAMVGVGVLWMVIEGSGLLDDLNQLISTMVSNPTDPTPFDIHQVINGPKVLGATAVISAINIVLFTALGTLGSFLYNLSATMLGGLEVTLAED